MNDPQPEGHMASHIEAHIDGLPVNDLRAAMPLYWLCYRHSNQISVVIGLDQGAFTEGHELDRKSVARQFQRLGQVDDLMSVDSDSHFALDLGNFSEVATQETKAQQVERSR